MKNKFKILFRIISVIIILICTILLIIWAIENYKNTHIQTNLIQSISIISSESSNDSNIINDLDNISPDEISKINVDYDSLKSTNSDSVGWIKINNTNINYPIVQSYDNIYYLNHNFEKNFNRAGWIFADYRNSFDILNQNTIIYGHNRRNGIMFSELKKYYDKDLTQNKYIYFNTNSNYYIGEIFSVYKVAADEADIPINFDDNDSFQNYLNTWLNKSKYNFNTSVDVNHNILTLCTSDNSSSYRILLHSKLVQIN